MKSSLRYRLNRLAETLVTPERFHARDSWHGFPIITDLRAPRDVIFLVSRPRPEPTDFYFDPSRMQIVGVDERPSAADLIEPACPFGNPDCPNPGRAAGFGFHAECSVYDHLAP